MVVVIVVVVVSDELLLVVVASSSSGSCVTVRSGVVEIVGTAAVPLDSHVSSSSGFDS